MMPEVLKRRWVWVVAAALLAVAGIAAADRVGTEPEMCGTAGRWLYRRHQRGRSGPKLATALYVISLGPGSTATRRLNLAQAFNPVGTNIGGLVTSSLILPKLADPVDIASLTRAQLRTIRTGRLGAVMGPYLGPRLAADLEDAVAKDKLPARAETGSHTQRGRVPPLASRLSRGSSARTPLSVPRRA